MSRVRLRVNDGVSALNSAHGEMSNIPPKGSANSEELVSASVLVTGCGRRSMGRDGCGCGSCETSCSARLPPAESPAMTMLDGDTPSIWRTCFGEGCSGTRACGTVNKKVDFTIAKRRTIVEQGNPDGTFVLLPKRLEHA